MLSSPTANNQEPTTNHAPNSAHAQDGGPQRLQISGTTRSEGALGLGDRLEPTKLRQYLYLTGTYALGRSDASPARTDFHFRLRGYYDGVYSLTDRYPRNVRRDEEDELSLREAVVKFASRRWNLQLGKQQTVWGEAVALFFADVVNPKDLREFILRDFVDIRLPVWALDARHYPGQDRVLELYWSPEVRFSRLPVPGAEFDFRQPAPPGARTVTLPERKPGTTFANSSLGFRYSQLIHGWDIAAFWYRAFDDLPAVSKGQAMVDGAPAVLISLLHPRVNRFGATFSAPSGNGVWKGEFVYATGRRFEAKAVAPPVERDWVTGMVGASYPVSRYNLDLQLFHTRILGAASPIRESSSRTGLSFRLADDASLRRLKPSLVLVVSPNQKDFLVSPRAQYRINDKTTLILGVDWMGGSRDTFFGRFRDASRFQIQWSRSLFDRGSGTRN